MIVITRRDLEAIPTSHWRQRKQIRWITSTMEQMDSDLVYPVFSHMMMEDGTVRASIMMASGEVRDLDLPAAVFNRLPRVEV